jgi:hypothetical protein
MDCIDDDLSAFGTAEATRRQNQIHVLSPGDDSLRRAAIILRMRCLRGNSNGFLPCL